MLMTYCIHSESTFCRLRAAAALLLPPNDQQQIFFMDYISCCFNSKRKCRILTRFPAIRPSPSHLFGLQRVSLLSFFLLFPIAIPLSVHPQSIQSDVTLYIYLCIGARSVVKSRRLTCPLGKPMALLFTAPGLLLLLLHQDRYNSFLFLSLLPALGL